MSEVTIERKRLLHFFTDEKVANDAIESFETAFPNENMFLILSKDGEPSFVKPHKNTLFLSYKSSELKDIIKACKDFGEVIFHSMGYEFSLIIQKFEHPNVNWVVWGADMYESLLYRKGYRLYIDEKNIFRVRARWLPVFLYKALIGIRDYKYYRAQIKASKKINTITSYGPDYDLLVKYYPEFGKCNKKYFFYYPIEKMLDEQTKDCFVSGKNIWVNPAAGYNGNHIDIFKRLSTFNHIERVCTPLSYGIPYYAKYVEREGRKFFENKFDPMTTFIPKEEYYKRFLSSNSFIFGHLRQCAVGNIIIALYMGAKVFLYKDNPLYNFYKSMGVSIYNIEDELNEDEVYSPLSDELRQKNRETMMRNYSYQKQISTIKNSF